MRQRRKKRLLTDAPGSKALPLLTSISKGMRLVLRSQEKENGGNAFDEGEWKSESFASVVIIVVFRFFVFCLKGFTFTLTLEPGTYPWSAMTWVYTVLIDSLVSVATLQFITTKTDKTICFPIWTEYPQWFAFFIGVPNDFDLPLCPFT